MKPYWKNLLKQYVDSRVEGDNKIAQAFRERFGDDVPITNAWEDGVFRKVTFTFEATSINGVLVAADVAYPTWQTREIELGAYTKKGHSAWCIWDGLSCDGEVNLFEGNDFYEACLQVASKAIAEPEEKPTTSLQDWLSGGRNLSFLVAIIPYLVLMAIYPLSGLISVILTVVLIVLYWKVMPTINIPPVEMKDRRCK